MSFQVESMEFWREECHQGNDQQHAHEQKQKRVLQRGSHKTTCLNESQNCVFVEENPDDDVLETEEKSRQQDNRKTNHY